MLNSNILNENEKNTLILKHGLHNNKEHSLREIGIKLNLSHQRIATILSDSYKKIRNSNYINEFSEVTDYKIKKQQN